MFKTYLKDGKVYLVFNDYETMYKFLDLFPEESFIAINWNGNFNAIVLTPAADAAEEHAEALERGKNWD